jgi:raffinose/stachyose/melibiose transport system substrate-binding protein
MKKSSLYVLIAVIVLAAVSSIVVLTKKNPSGTSSQTKEKAVTLTFGIHQSGLPTSGIVQSLAKEYEAETGVKVDFQVTPDAQWRDLIKVKLDSGEAPDVFCVDTPINLASSLKVAKYCVPLTNEEWVSRMYPTTVAAVSDNGNVYGISFAGPKMYFYIYNKKIFEKYNLTPPTSYAEFKKVCSTLLKNGVTPVYEATTDGWHQVLPLFETGGLYLSKDPDLYSKLNKNEINFDKVPDLLVILNELNESARLGYFGKDYLSNAWENAKEALATGKCAMTIAELGFKSEIHADYPDAKAEDFGQFVMPWGDNQVIGVNPASNAYFINKDSKHIDEAKAFFSFLAKNENLVKRLEGQEGINEVCWTGIKTKYSDSENTYINAHSKANVVQTSVNYVDSQWMDVGKDLESMYMGTKTTEDVLQSIIKRRNEQAELLRDPGWVK